VGLPPRYPSEIRPSVSPSEAEKCQKYSSKYGFLGRNFVVITLVQRATVMINMSRSRHVNLGLAAWITNTSRHSTDITI